MRDSIPWQEDGARARHSTVNALVRISMVLEKAILKDDPFFGIALKRF